MTELAGREFPPTRPAHIPLVNSLTGKGHAAPPHPTLLLYRLLLRRKWCPCVRAAAAAAATTAASLAAAALAAAALAALAALAEVTELRALQIHGAIALGAHADTLVEFEHRTAAAGVLEAGVEFLAGAELAGGEGE